MNENSDFEQDYLSRTAKSIYKIGHDGDRIMKWLALFFRSFYEKINFHDLMGSILKIFE